MKPGGISRKEVQNLQPFLGYGLKEEPQDFEEPGGQTLAGQDAESLHTPTRAPRSVKEKAIQEIERQYVDPFNQRKSRKELEQPQSASGSSSAPMHTRTRSAMAGASEGTENRHLSLLKEFDEESSEEDIGERESTEKESSEEEESKKRKATNDLAVTPYSTGDTEPSPQRNGEVTRIAGFLEPEDEAVVRAIIEKYAGRLLAASEGTDDKSSDWGVDWEFGMSGWDSRS
ncbi:hypothetical protein W97_06893 [Coniosporium apollinis CBS 100218]|uniref:Uncharacterized protein n=1 Tax=Coniosporium apollinis (strain CBS 100218) TaxID=1168221 RepID=R7Z003_CONA1|nr:uncharacterized protein W97_06893 [Coniosporium apollinis CBS 100218]EON67525.1 hypothetical protein W97_06893 [Coniosporium apollinis CBS 100218]